MFVVDASVWVSRFLPDDDFHKVSKAWLDKMIEEGIVLAAPALLIPEVAGAIARRTGSARAGIPAARLLEDLPNGKIMPIDAVL